VEPDVKIEDSELSKLAIHLLVNGYIFDYATRYYYAHPTIAPATSFTFSNADFEDFKTWIAAKNLTYKTESEDALASLKATMEADKTLDKYKAEFIALSNKLSHDRNQDIANNKAEISRLLANEI